MWKFLKCLLLGHNWVKYRFWNYIDVSYNDRATSHIIYYCCSRCSKLKEKIMYGAGHIESLDEAE